MVKGQGYILFYNKILIFFLLVLRKPSISSPIFSFSFARELVVPFRVQPYRSLDLEVLVLDFRFVFYTVHK